MQPLSRTQHAFDDAGQNSQIETRILDATPRAHDRELQSRPYTGAVCLEAGRLFEQCAAGHLVEAQDWADQGVTDSALELQTKARVAQQRANAWHLRAKTASN